LSRQAKKLIEIQWDCWVYTEVASLRFIFHSGEVRISPMLDVFFCCLYWSDDGYVLRQSMPTPRVLMLAYTILYTVRYNNENGRKKRNEKCQLFYVFHMLTSSSLTVFDLRVLALKSSIYIYIDKGRRRNSFANKTFIYSSILM